MRRLLFALLLATPTIALAAPPAVVTGLSAQVKGANVLVQWTAAPESARIDHYRVYFSRQSILGNSGDYDDVVETADNKPQYLLMAPVNVDTLFIAVLAVKTSGEAGGTFVEEIEVALSGSVEESEEVNEHSSSEKLEILSARATSATGVLLTFSDPLNYTAQEALSLFRIDDGDGKTLVIRRIDVRGKEVVLHTFPQAPGKVYGVSLSKDMKGKSSSSGREIALNPNKSTVLFQGFTKTGSSQTPPPPAPAPAPTPAPAPAMTPPKKLPLVVRKPGAKDLTKSGLPAGALAQAGPGALAVMVLSGAAGGFWRARRKKREV